MKKVVFGFLCFCSVIASINVLLKMEQLGILGTIVGSIVSFSITYGLYRLATEDDGKYIHNQTIATAQSASTPQTQVYHQHKKDFEDLPPITDEQLEIERAKIKANKLKKIHSDKDKFAIVICLFIPIFGWLYVAFRLHRYLMKERYFMSKEFIQHKMQIDSFVKEYNAIAKYVEQFQTISLQSNSSDKYKYAHLATGSNTSAYNIQRNRNVVNQSRYVHNASLQVVRNAELEPFKYLCKYFDFKPNEENLQYIQELGEQVSRFLNAKRNLDARYNRIIGSIRPPYFILAHYKDELLHLIEVKLPRISFQFPTYTFQYVSAGGNSSQTTSITLNEETIEMLIEYMDEQVKYKNSAKAQRSLMTKKLREYIKRRDEYTCQSCGASTAQQDLLLLEVDHIIPVAKGGLSTEDNLQTLCWKCNRTKSDKILSV